MRVIFCVLLIMAALPVYAVSDANLQQLYENSDASEMIGYADDTADVISSDFEQVKKKIEQLNPELVKKYSDKSMEEQIVAYRSYVAQRAYQYYEDYYIDKIKARGKETGREVKTRKWDKNGKEIYMWLDNGRLDLPECHVDGNVTDYQTCPYPTGHEEFYIDMQSKNDADNYYMQLFVYQDDAANNRTTKCNFWVNQDSSYSASVTDGNSDVMSDQDIYLHASCSVSVFEEEEEYRNQEIARMGKDIPVEELPFLPGAYVSGRNINYMRSYHKYKSVPDADK